MRTNLILVVSLVIVMAGEYYFLLWPFHKIIIEDHYRVGTGPTHYYDASTAHLRDSRPDRRAEDAHLDVPIPDYLDYEEEMPPPDTTNSPRSGDPYAR